MRNQVNNNCPRNFPLLHICFQIWQKLPQTIDTAREPSTKRNGYGKGTREEAASLQLGTYCHTSIRTSSLSYSQVFPKTEPVFSPHTQLQLVKVLITTKI